MRVLQPCSFCKPWQAYCINVYLKAQNIDEGHSKARMTGSSIAPFLIAFGKDNSVSTKSKSGGVVAEYAELMGKAIKQYDMGLGNYMLTKLNSAVLEGRNVLTVEKVDGKTEYTIAWDTVPILPLHAHLSPSAHTGCCCSWGCNRSQST
jgi:hypothetical protein